MVSLLMFFQILQTFKSIVTVGAGVIVTIVFLVGPLTMTDRRVFGMLGVHVLTECVFSCKLLATLGAVQKVWSMFSLGMKV